MAGIINDLNYWHPQGGFILMSGRYGKVEEGQLNQLCQLSVLTTQFGLITSARDQRTIRS